MSYLLRASLLALLSAALPAQQFTVITSNIWHSGTKGFNYVTGQLPLGHATTWPGIKGFYKARIPRGYGVIGMQEVEVFSNRIGKIHTPADLASSMGSGWTYRFGGLEPSDGGTAGNGVVTNVTVAKTQYWRFNHDPGNIAQTGKHPRGAVAMRLDFGGKPLWLVSTHLATANAVAMRQVWQLLGRIKTFDPDFPVIVVGDLNIRNRAPGTGTPEQTYYKMAAAFQLADFTDVSYQKNTSLLQPPSTVLDGQLDYMFVYDPHGRIQLDSCQPQWVFSYPNVYTDHLALVARFHWK